MKKIYEIPELSFTLLAARDVISASGEYGGSDFPDSGLENKGNLSGDGWGPIIPVN